MTPAVRIALIFAALALVGAGVGVAVYADGWFRWVLALFIVGTAVGCIKEASSDGSKSEEVGRWV